MNLLFLASALVISFSAAAQKIPIPKPFTACKKHSDCAVTTSLCGCCDYTAMNKKFVKKYAALVKYCEQPVALCSCEKIELVPRCVKKICKFVPKT